MGEIEISIRGSFGPQNDVRTFSAMDRGHASAVASAIEFLSGSLLPKAISLDHRLHVEGHSPKAGFGCDAVMARLGQGKDVEQIAREAYCAYAIDSIEGFRIDGAWERLDSRHREFWRSVALAIREV
jgi:hypothetical protein